MKKKQITRKIKGRVSKGGNNYCLYEKQKKHKKKMKEEKEGRKKDNLDRTHYYSPC